MRERLEEILAKIKEQQEKLSKKQKIIIIASLAAFVVFVVGAILLLNNTGYATLYTDLAEQEVSEVSAKLTEQEVPFKISGTTISVPADKVDQLRVTLASQGYPKSGLAYDTFKNNVDLMTTNEEKTFYEIADLQDRMAGNIRMINGVKEATVKIALGEDKKYVLEKDKIKSSASVTVLMKDGGSPTTEQARSIQRLVAFGVPGMEMDSVVVIDGNGNTVSSTNDNGQTGTAQLKRNLEMEIENSTRAKIMNLIEPVYGEDSIRVTVNANVNVDKTIREIINYNPTTEDNKGVISKENLATEIVTGAGTTGGVPGTETNADIPLYPGVTYNNGELYFNDQQNIDYLVNQIKEQVQSDSGMLTDLTVSLTLDSDKAQPRELDALKELVANAAAIPLGQVDDKVVIFTAKFTANEEAKISFIEDFKANPLKYIPYIVGILALLIVIIVSLILFMKKKKKAVEEEEKILEEGVMSINVNEEVKDLQDITPTREMELKNEIRDFAENNPEIAAQLIKTWLRGGDSNEQ